MGVLTQHDLRAKYSRIHYMTAKSFGKDTDRKKERSRTYSGIGEAMALQWG